MYQQPSYQGDRITLDDNNSDLHLTIGPDGVSGWDMHDKGFEYMWAGGRATHGVNNGKVCFECSVLEYQQVDMPDTERTPHVLRVGWSVDGSDLQLGEASLSYGYGGTGKISSNNKFLDYGQPFGVGDTLTCYLDLDAHPAAIFYAKNGQYLGVAFNPGPELRGKTLYPHVNVKNVKFELNFGDRPPRFPLTPGFQMMQWLPPNMLTPVPYRSNRKEDHEVLMMVGLPGAGKSTWCEQYAKQHPEKKYYILGTNLIMEKMKVMGLKRQKNYHGRWDQLIKQATNCLNQVFKIAERKVRNYILDQTNVYFTARRRKMNNFRGYKRIAVVIMNERDELDRRTEKRTVEEGKVVPESAVKEMMANLTLPEVGESFDEVRHIEVNEGRAKELMEIYKKEGQEFKNQEKKRSSSDISQENEPPGKRFAPNQGGPSPRGPPAGPPSFSSRSGHSGYPPRGPDSFTPRGANEGFRPRAPQAPGGYPSRVGQGSPGDYQRSERDYQRGPPLPRMPSVGTGGYSRDQPWGEAAPPPRDSYQAAGSYRGDYRGPAEGTPQQSYGQGRDYASPQSGSYQSRDYSPAPSGGYSSYSMPYSGNSSGASQSSQPPSSYDAPDRPYSGDTYGREYESQGYDSYRKGQSGYGDQSGQSYSTYGAAAYAGSQQYGGQPGGQPAGQYQSGPSAPAASSQPTQGYSNQGYSGQQGGYSAQGSGYGGGYYQ
ncbi:heterogeneous nuclear ribonucleoprotein U-like protein 1 [Glandiceps talaboti]